MNAALNTAKYRAGWGVTARQEDGGILSAWAGSVERNGEAMVEKDNAIRIALIKAEMMGWRRIEVQSDFKGVVEKSRQEAGMI